MALTSEQSESIANTFTGLAERLGFETQAEVTETGEGITIRVTTPEPGRLIGRKGHSLDSLEYLLNRIVSHKYGNDFPRIRVDVDGDGEKQPRQQSRKPEPDRSNKPSKVEQLALDAAKEVKRWGESKSIGPFSERDLESVRNVLRDDPEIIVEVGDSNQKGRREVTVRVVEQEQE